MVNLIAFDLDGTLIDSRLDLAGAVNYMRSSMGLEPLTVPRIVSFIGTGMANLVRRAIADTELDFDESLKRMRAYYAEHLTDTTSLYEGVADGLRALHLDGRKLVLVTNKPAEASNRILSAFQIAEYFDDVIGGDSDFPMKPEPDSLLAMAKKYQFSPGECWIAGDNWTDLAAGNRAGFHCALVRYGFGDPQSEKFDSEVQSFPEFVELIKHIR